MNVNEICDLGAAIIAARELPTSSRRAGLDLFPDSTGKEINEDWLRVFGIRIRLPYGDARAWSDWAKVAGESV